MRSPLNVVQYNRRSGDLVWKEDTFKALRQRPEFCFFDKTAFITTLDARALVFLRPRRSGKSLAMSTLAHFHGREHLLDYKPLFEVGDLYLLKIMSICLKCCIVCLSRASVMLTGPCHRRTCDKQSFITGNSLSFGPPFKDQGSMYAWIPVLCALKLHDNS